MFVIATASEGDLVTDGSPVRTLIEDISGPYETQIEALGAAILEREDMTANSDNYKIEFITTGMCVYENEYDNYVIRITPKNSSVMYIYPLYPVHKNK